MRRLIMMRHAKSSWTSDAPSDHARPLNKRGVRSAVAVGDWLRASDWRPDRVLLSDSVRTQETLQRMRLSPPVAADLRASLYHAKVDQVRAAVGAVSAAETLLVLGHEPGWSEAVAWLSGATVELKTADLALLRAKDEAEWAELVGAPERFTLVEVIRSRALLRASAR